MKLQILALVASILLVFGCDNPNRRYTYQTSGQQVNTVTATSAPSSIMNSNDLDLATISDAIRSGRVQDAASLQNVINDPSNALNNVDLDKDGIIDPITVQEVQTRNGKTFNLVANSNNGQATPVATIDLNVSAGGQVMVQAGYPNYVAGYQDNYYSYAAPANIAFMAWALGPRTFWLAQPYASYGWSSHSIFAPDVVTRSRTTYDTQMHVSPVQRSAPPSSFVQKEQAYRTPSGFAKSTQTAPRTNNLNDRSTARDFSVRDSSQPVQRATRFGATPAATSTSSFGSSAPASTSTSRPMFRSSSPSGPSVSPPPASTSSFRPSFNSSSPSGPRTSLKSK